MKQISIHFLLTSMSPHVIHELAAIGEATAADVAGTGLLAVGHADVHTDAFGAGKELAALLTGH